MTQLFRRCIACIRTRRSQTINVTSRVLPALGIFLFAAVAEGQIQVDLKFKRLQYIAYEPVVATLSITNLAGRDIDLHNADGQSWLGFEITGSEGQPIAPMRGENGQAPLKIEAGQRVTHQINLTPLYPVHDFGTYHVRTNVYFADLGKFFYSPTRVFEVTDARPIWQQTVGIPDGVAAPGNVRTYSLLTNRFPDHTSLYVRVQDKDSWNCLCDLFVRPGHRFRRTTGGDRSRKSIACSALLRSTRLGVFARRLKWRTDGALLLHGNQNPAAPCSCRKWRRSRARRHD